MKTFIVALGLLTGLSAHAGYSGQELNNWLKDGQTRGVDSKGRVCDVWVKDYSGMTTVQLEIEGVALHKVPRFNTYMSAQLENINETSSSIEISVKSKASNSYTADVRQTISVKKTSRGTVVTMVEKQMGLFGSSLKGDCIID